MCLGIPGRIIAITDEANNLAEVDIAGVKREVNIACVVEPDQAIDSILGAWVLVHVGFAMSIIDEEEAARTLAILSELEEAQEEIEIMQNS